MQTMNTWKFLNGNIKLVGDVFVDETNKYCAYLYIQIGETLTLVAHDNEAGDDEQEAHNILMLMVEKFTDYGFVRAD